MVPEQVAAVMGAARRRILALGYGTHRADDGSGRQPAIHSLRGCGMAVTEAPAVRVLLIDNATGRRDVMQTIINSPVVGGQVVGEAVDADSAVAAVAACEPDVAVLEIQLPLKVGFDLL